LHEAAIQSLGRIHSNPDVVIPLLVSCLTNDDSNEAAAYALANFGSVAREAFPKLVPLLKNGDPHVRSAARTALKKIDPETAAKTEGVPIGTYRK
jgi:HEAT repeat protein